MSQSRTLRVTQQLQSPGMRLARTARNFVVLAAISRSFAQSPPVSAGRPWHWSEEQKTMRDSLRFHPLTVRIDSGKLYSLAELIDLAEAQNPATRVTWEKARAQAASIGIARSELFPTLSAVAMAGVVRQEAALGSQFYRQTVPSFQVSLNLNYTMFDFGARRNRIHAEQARLLAANFTFNDVHRQLIYDVSQAYYRLVDAAGREEAAGASLVNAQNVQQAAEERLRNGLATLPDVLEARSATAQTQYDLQAVLGAEHIAQGDLLMALGAPAHTPIRVQSLIEVPTLESVSESMEEAIQRALLQRPDLQAQVADIQAAQAERQMVTGRVPTQPERSGKSQRTIALPSPADAPLGTHSGFKRWRGVQLELEPL